MNLGMTLRLVKQESVPLVFLGAGLIIGGALLLGVRIEGVSLT